MRGPSVRKKYDVRRLWRCPQCKQERHVAQTVTTVRCSCTSSGVQMQLVEPQRYVRATPPPLDLVMTEADCDPDPIQESTPSATEIPADISSSENESQTESIDFSDVVPGQNDHANLNTPDVDPQPPTEVPPGELNNAI